MTAGLPLTLACWDYDRTRALADGRVRAEGIDLRYLPMKMPESFFRMLQYGEFHASEMSLSWYVRSCARDPRPFVALPVFPSRMFRHGSIYVHAGSGIREPGDLIGKRVGCPEYQMTAAVWIKGILADHHGVPVNSVTYHVGGLKEPGRQEVPFTIPPERGIHVEPISAQRTLSEMLETGELDALYTAEAPTGFEHGSPNVRRLFPDHEAAERSYLRATGIFPIMHTVVLRRDVYERDPWVAQSLTKAFEAAKELAYQDLNEVVALKTMLPWLTAHLESTREAFGKNDYWAYGIEANRANLEQFLRYSHDQGLIPRLFAPEELFARETLRTSKI